MRIVTLLALLLVVGCTGEPSDIEVEFLKTARKTTITPIFPPKEDIQVGDMFALSFGGPNDVLREYLATDAKVAELAWDFMETRFALRETIALNNTLTINAPLQTDTYGRSLARRSDLVIESLPLDALPSVTADASAAFGFGQSGFFSALGLGGGRRTKVTLDFGDVRSYGIPIVELVRRGYDPEKRTGEERLNIYTTEAVKDALSSRYNSAIASGRKILPWEERCESTALVTKVFLTRQIKYTFFDARIAAIAAATAEKDSRPTAPDVPPISVTINNKDVDTNAVEAATDTLSTEVLKATQQAGVSGSLTFEGFSVLGATYTQIFQRPVVVGYEAIAFRNPQIPASSDELDSRTDSQMPSLETLARLKEEIERCAELTRTLP